MIGASPANRRWRRMLRLAGGNVMACMAGLGLIGIIGEGWFRLKTPSMTEGKAFAFVPQVGVLYEPSAEIRVTNRIDFWSASKVNRLGFLDREPPDPGQTAMQCHVVVIGDSFVAAEQVAISDKLHVQFEALAAQQLPALDITASAFGFMETGQISQLAFYDQFARQLRPKLIVLVFVANDFRENMPLNSGSLLHVSAQRGENGALLLRPPDPDYQFPQPSLGRRLINLARVSYFAQWVDAKMDAIGPWADPAEPVGFQDVLDFTGFALDQFKARADRDGAALAILATHSMRAGRAGRWADYANWLSVLAEERSIPVIDQHEHILRQGGNYKDGRWTHDGHWNPTGHRWAAEALLLWLKRNQDICA